MAENPVFVFTDFAFLDENIPIFDEEEPTSRFPEADKSVLEEMRENNVNKNTQKSTKTWLRVFDLWRAERKEVRKLEDIPEDELDDILCRFFFEIRKKDGQDYEPDRLAVMQSALDRHIKNCGRPYSILRDRKFAKSRQQLDAKARQLREKGYGKKQRAANALSKDDEEHLWNSRELGKHSPEALVNVNFKNLTEHFGLRGRQEHYSMEVQDFITYTSPDGSTKYITFKEGLTKTRSGGLRVMHRAVQPKMYATGGERCPVMLFEEMIQRRPPELRTSGPVYLGIISKPKGDIWYSRQRMGEHRIGQIMKTMAAKSGLASSTGKRLTNHSSRKTCVQKLKNAGVPRDQIIDITGHRNISSLNSYEGDDEKEAQKLSNIISGVNPQPLTQQAPVPRSPLMSRNSIVHNTTNTFTGTVNFYGGFSGMFKPNCSPEQQAPKPDSESTSRSWKRLRVITDSDED